VQARSTQHCQCLQSPVHQPAFSALPPPLSPQPAGRPWFALQEAAELIYLQQKQHCRFTQSLQHYAAAALSLYAGDTVAGSAGAGGTGQSAAEAAPPGIARFQEAFSIKGLRLSASLQLVFELYCAKPSVAGLPSKELQVAWAATPVLQGGQVGAIGCVCVCVCGGGGYNWSCTSERFIPHQVTQHMAD
jgi:hypothetical protein